MNKYDVDVTWSGRFPNLCSGSWTLRIDGTDYSNMIPDELKNSCMDTYGVYSSWEFDEHWMEYQDSYCDGLEETDWIRKNKSWLRDITPAPDLQKQIFRAFQKIDFRPGSCGGCI